MFQIAASTTSLQNSGLLFKLINIFVPNGPATRMSHDVRGTHDVQRHLRGTLETELLPAVVSCGSNGLF